MTPVSLNPPAHSLPLTDHQKEDKNHVFYSPTHQDPTNCVSSLASCSIFDDSYTRDISKQRHDQKPVMDDWGSVCGPKNKKDKEEMSSSSSSHNSSEKWKCSEMRLKQKMKLSSSPGSSNSPTWRKYNKGNIITNRVCADCSTTSTPLWRSGPNGPKSLCNACGIRQRKARKAMEEAVNNGLCGSSTRARIVHKEEKGSQMKNKWKGSPGGRCQPESEGKRKVGFKDFELSLRRSSAFQQRLFPRDEVVEGALLLMDLSCGFIPF